MTLVATLSLILVTPAIASAGGPSRGGGFSYGSGDSFSRFSGPGFVLHSGSHGEEDVNVCSTQMRPGTASCDARVVTIPSNATDASNGPASEAVSSCTTGDLNAPAAAVSGGNGGYDPCYLQSAYNVATAAEGNGGDGQIIAIVDYSVDPDIAANLATYRSQFGLPACPTGIASPSNSGCVFEEVAQSGAPSSGDSGWDVETSLDVDAVSAVCPNCQILLIEANSTSTSTLGSGVNTAVADGANAVSNSYGGSEFSGETSPLSESYFEHPGVAIVASTGDTAGEVEFPAVVPDVIAVGGTSLLQTSDTGTRSSAATETVWDGTPNASDGSGSGCSAYESAASWQSSFLTAAGGTGVCSRRVTADVSADADPDTGIWVYDTYSEGGWLIVGGTSLAAPLVAGIYGLAGNATGSTAYPGTTLYANAASLYHVTAGNVGSCGNYLCDATKSIDGYNGPTGLGTPGGVGAIAAFVFDPSAPPAIDPLPPAAIAATAVSSSDVIVVGRSPQSVLWYQQSSGGGSSWTGWQSLATTDAASQPAVVASGSNIYVFFRATNNELHYFVDESGIWSTEQDLGGQVAGNPAAAVDGNGQVIVACLNSAGNVFEDSLPSGGSWSGWTTLAGVLSGNITLTSLSGNLYLLGLNSSGLGWSIEWSAGSTNTWGSWTTLGGVFASGTTLSGAAYGGTLHVQGVNPQGIDFESTGSGTTFSSWTSLDGILAGTPALAAPASGLFMFDVNGPGLLWDQEDTTSWQGWNALSGVLEGAPIAVAAGANAFVFGLNQAGNLWFREWNGTSFGAWTNLGGIVATA
jgi:hypothetical protein